VYVAGFFDVLGGQARTGLGSVDARTGRARRWNPDCDGEVAAVVVGPAGSPVYVAGEFASIGGKSRRGLAAVDAKLGTATLWDPGVGGAVHAIALDSTRRLVYAGGSFEAVGDLDRTNLPPSTHAPERRHLGMSPRWATSTSSYARHARAWRSVASSSPSARPGARASLL
jgi:hypothetical protein